MDNAFIHVSDFSDGKIILAIAEFEFSHGLIILVIAEFDFSHG